MVYVKVVNREIKTLGGLKRCIMGDLQMANI